MNSMGNDRRELVRAVYEQHAAHARHLESQRLSFTIVYSVLLTATVILWGIRPFWSSGWPVMALLAVFSLFGFIFFLESQRTLKAYFASTALILERYSLDHYLPGGAKHIRLGSQGLGVLFPILYLLGLSFSLFILFRILFESHWISIILSLLIFVIGAVIAWRYEFHPRVGPKSTSAP